jgi:hypothetical protein
MGFIALVFAATTATFLSLWLIRSVDGDPDELIDLGERDPMPLGDHTVCTRSNVDTGPHAHRRLVLEDIPPDHKCHEPQALQILRAYELVLASYDEITILPARRLVKMVCCTSEDRVQFSTIVVAESDAWYYHHSLRGGGLLGGGFIYKWHCPNPKVRGPPMAHVMATSSRMSCPHHYHGWIKHFSKDARVVSLAPYEMQRTDLARTSEVHVLNYPLIARFFKSPNYKVTYMKVRPDLAPLGRYLSNGVIPSGWGHVDPAPLTRSEALVRLPEVYSQPFRDAIGGLVVTIPIDRQRLVEAMSVFPRWADLALAYEAFLHDMVPHAEFGTQWLQLDDCCPGVEPAMIRVVLAVDTFWLYVLEFNPDPERMDLVVTCRDHTPWPSGPGLPFETWVHNPRVAPCPGHYKAHFSLPPPGAFLVPRNFLFLNVGIDNPNTQAEYGITGDVLAPSFNLVVEGPYPLAPPLEADVYPETPSEGRAPTPPPEQEQATADPEPEVRTPLPASPVVLPDDPPEPSPPSPIREVESPMELTLDAGSPHATQFWNRSGTLLPRYQTLDPLAVGEPIGSEFDDLQTKYARDWVALGDHMSDEAHDSLVVHQPDRSRMFEALLRALVLPENWQRFSRMYKQHMITLPRAAFTDDKVLLLLWAQFCIRGMNSNARNLVVQALKLNKAIESPEIPSNPWSYLGKRVLLTVPVAAPANYDTGSLLLEFLRRYLRYPTLDEWRFVMHLTAGPSVIDPFVLLMPEQVVVGPPQWVASSTPWPREPEVPELPDGFEVSYPWNDEDFQITCVSRGKAALASRAPPPGWGVALMFSSAGARKFCLVPLPFWCRRSPEKDGPLEEMVFGSIVTAV